MHITAILSAVKMIKDKNPEGYYRIPQWVLKSGIEILIKPLLCLFELILTQTKFPMSGSLHRSYCAQKGKQTDD